jgi:hypothetical protein
LVGLGLAALCAALVGLSAPAASGAAEPEVVTAAADNLRTGWYPDESTLTPQLLREGRFERLFTTPVRGQLYAQPLVADGVLLAVTEQNWVYGIDPGTGAVQWSRQLGAPLDASVLHCGVIGPDVGVTGTPVIDAKTGVAYLVAISHVSGDTGPVAWYLHALELATGTEPPGFPVAIEGEAQNLPGTRFVAERELQRPALLLSNGVVYAAFGGDHCDEPPYQGWVAGVSTSGRLQAMWASASEGASIWQAGGGLASDGPGRILLATGNNAGNVPSPALGPGNAPPAGLAESVVRLAVQADGSLRAADFFSPSNNTFLDQQDLDQGSGAPVALPAPYFGTPSVPDLVVQSGKTGELYLLNGEALGGMGQGTGGTNDVVQELGPYGGVWDQPAAWPGDGGYVYVPGVSPPSSNSIESADYLRFFKYGLDGAGSPSLSLAATSPDPFAYGSGSPIVTSNGTASGSAILWIVRCPEPGSRCTAAELRAYEAVPSDGQPVLLWSAPIGFGPKFAHPDASGGAIYLGTRDERVLGFAKVSSPPLTGSDLSFPTTLVGQSSTQEETLRASRSVEVQSVVAEGSFAVGSSPALPAFLAPGQPLTMPVRYSPTAKGTAHGVLKINTSGGSVTFTLTGGAIVAGITPSPLTLALGTAPVGHRLEATVQLTNTGEVPLTVSAVQPPAAPFQASGLPTVGTTLEPGQAVAVTAGFDSAQPGGFASVLALTTQAGRTTVTLTASATAEAPAPPAGGGLSPPPPSGAEPSSLLPTSPAGPLVPPLLVSPVPPAPVALTAALSGVRVTPSVARPMGSSAGGERIRFRLSAPARVEVVVELGTTPRACPARRKCVRARCARARGCALYLPRRRANVSARAGVNRVSLPTGGLAPGVYRVAITVLSRTGRPAATRYAYFRIGG